MVVEHQRRNMMGAVLYGLPVPGLPHLPRCKYVVDRLRGSGAFGTVYLAKRYRLVPRVGPRPVFEDLHDAVVAIKFVPLRRDLQYLCLVKREVTILNKLTHPHIIAMTDRLEVPRFVDEEATGGRAVPAIGIVMDCAQQTLQKYLDSLQRKHKDLQEGAARWWFQQLILAVDHCHAREIGQRDIKPGNILIFQGGPTNLNIRLADFGSAKQVDRSEAKTRAGTMEYMAPELPDTRYGACYSAQRADVWSCGMVLLQMLFPAAFDARLPVAVQRDEWQAWAQERIQEYEQAVAAGRDTTGLRSADSIRLLVRMLEVDPKQRATIAEVKAHPWFKKQLPPGAMELNERALKEQARFDEVELEGWLDDVAYQHTDISLQSQLPAPQTVQ